MLVLTALLCCLWLSVITSTSCSRPGLRLSSRTLANLVPSHLTVLEPVLVPNWVPKSGLYGDNVLYLYCCYIVDHPLTSHPKVLFLPGKSYLYDFALEIWRVHGLDCPHSTGLKVENDEGIAFMAIVNIHHLIVALKNSLQIVWTGEKSNVFQIN